VKKDTSNKSSFPKKKSIKNAKKLLKKLRKLYKKYKKLVSENSPSKKNQKKSKSNKNFDKIKNKHQDIPHLMTISKVKKKCCEKYKVKDKYCKSCPLTFCIIH